MLSERRSALLANQEKWKERVPTENKTPDIHVAKMSSLEARKMALLQASGCWKDRVKQDESIKSLNSTYRIKSELFSTPTSNKNILKENVDLSSPSKSVPRQMKFATPCVSELAKTTVMFKPKPEELPEKMQLEIEERSPKLTSITRRPTMPKTRRLPSSLAMLHVDTSSSPSTSTAVKRSPDSDKENEAYHGRAPKECLSEERKRKILLSSPKPLKVSPVPEDRTPVLGVKNCGIFLKKPEIKRPYPDLMLIRCKGSKMVDVRCVSPRLSSIHECATFVLVTSNRLMIFEGEFSSVIERTKAKQIGHSVISTRDLSCLTSKMELVKDDIKIERDFIKLLSHDKSEAGDYTTRPEKIPKELLKYIDPESEEVFEDAVKESNCVYEIESGEATLILKGEVPYSGLLNSEKILVFDFGSEIYIWIGHDADRSIVKYATDFADNLKKSSILNSSLLFSDNFFDSRPDWIVIRKITEGLPDCLFRLKFADPLPIPSPKTPKTPRFSTPRFVMASKPSPKKSIDLCGLEEKLKDEDELIEQLSGKLLDSEPKEHVLELEETLLRPEDGNIYTEGLMLYKLDSEVLVEMEHFDEFFDDNCYVIKWLYRVERKGVRKLNGTPGIQKETGRQRTAYFYWFGKNVTKKSKGACALALRKFDKDRREHVLMEQGNVIPLFMHLLEGKMIISSSEFKDKSKRAYVVHGSTGNYFYSEEVDFDHLNLRPQTVYIIIDKNSKQLSLWKGKFVNKELMNGASKISEKMMKLHGLTLSNQTINGVEVSEPYDWRRAPRMFRLYDTEGEVIQSIQYSKTVNFSHRQNELKGTIMIDQESCLWIWTDVLVSTLHLQIASKYWKSKNRREKPATVLCKGKETDEFKALFPEWKDNIDSIVGSPSDFVAEEPRDLNDLLDERTRPRTLEEVRERKLPLGCDTKRLEKFLSDQDFELVFKMNRASFYSLPKWKQTSLKKEAKLF